MEASSSEQFVNRGNLPRLHTCAKIVLRGSLVTGAKSTRRSEHGPLAQLAEQGTLNPLVTGSSPVRVTVKTAHVQGAEKESLREFQEALLIVTHWRDQEDN